MISQLFAAHSADNQRINNQLDKTIDLVKIAREQTESFIDYLETNKDDETLKQDVIKSMEDYTVLERLIKNVVQEADIETLKEIPMEDVKRMIKSQSSSKSHTKKKLKESGGEGYFRTYVQSAIAEELLRRTYNIPKSSSGFGRVTRTSITYTEEELQELAQDQFKLRSAIRNVQSKKCTELKKLEKGETNERLEQILTAEEQLKGIRVAVAPQASVKVKIVEKLDITDDYSSMKKDELVKLLNDIKETANE